MFSFFKRKSGKPEAATETPEPPRKQPNDEVTKLPSVDLRAPRNDATNETSSARKDVVNLLLPNTNYHKKTGVSALFKMMSGKKNNKKTERAESCRVSPQKEMHVLQRSKSDLEPSSKPDTLDDVPPPTPAKNTPDAAQAHAESDPADFVKALVLQKYANKPNETKQHVSTVYASNENDLNDRRHAEALLREIARSIDCTISKLNVNNEQMGTTDSKSERIKEPVYEIINEPENNNTIERSNYLQNLIDYEKETLQNDFEKERSVDGSVSPVLPKKSNLKLPRSDTEGASDDDRSDSGKRRVIFNKHIVFDDGDQQTDEESDSTFESFTSGEEESAEETDEYLVEEFEESVPDNDEFLGGVVVSRNDCERTVIDVTDSDHRTHNEPVQIKIEYVDEIQRIPSDNSDSGFVDSDKQDISIKIVEQSDSESDVSSSEEEVEEEIEEEEVEIEEVEEEEIEEEVEEIEDNLLIKDDSNEDSFTKTLVTQEGKFQSQVTALTELADTRCGELEKARELIAAYRKEIEEKVLEIERLKVELAAAYKEAEMIRQRSRSLEEELCAARSCSADLADQLRDRDDDSLQQLQADLEDSLTKREELESRVLALEQDRDILLQEKLIQEQKAEEVLAAAEANTEKWRAAHEAARSQAAARAERIMSDCEWKMRELEKRARDAEKERDELIHTVEELKSVPPPCVTHAAELKQLRGLLSEQHRSAQALSLQLQKVETREEALKLEVHRLKELLEKQARISKEKEDRFMQTIDRLEHQHSKAIETLKAEYATAAASSRAALERNHAERTRSALAQLRAEAEKEARNAERKLREATTRFENLKEVLASKESQFESAIAEAHSKADWDIMQLRHLLDKADITYANNVEKMNERFEKEKERLIEEWSTKVQEIEEEAVTAAEEARKLLETTKMKLIAEKNDQISKLTYKHKVEMEEQWENFMTDKENCLARMKLECRQEGEEERVKREKELLEEIADLKALLQSKSIDYEGLTAKTAQCERTLEVTEQELREALARERDLRAKTSEGHSKITQLERANKEQVEHLTRKCACLRKLFDDMRARLAQRERAAETEARAKEKELHTLRAEVARLTKLLMVQETSDLGARTRADGCEDANTQDEFIKPDGSKRKGGNRAPEFYRKRPTLPDLLPLPPEARRPYSFDGPDARKRANSVDLPAVQVPCRIKQFDEKTKDTTNH